MGDTQGLQEDAIQSCGRLEKKGLKNLHLFPKRAD